jgi:hypothetical protein
VGEHLSPINAFPVEGTVREFVEDAPGQLLSQEPIDGRLLHDLGQLGTVPECIRHEEYFSIGAEFFL